MVLHRILTAMLTMLALASALNTRVTFAQEIELTRLISTAAKGSTVALPPGTLRVPAGGIDVPAGVRVRGAGPSQTVLDATGVSIALRLRNADDAGVENLTIRGATQAAVCIERSARVTVSGAVLVNNVIGVRVDQAGELRLENLVIARNHTGLVLTGVKRGCLVNATVADNTALGLTASGCDNLAIFNSLLVGSSVAVALGEGNTNLTLDHNIYAATIIGRELDQAPRITLDGWRGLRGQDLRSISVGVNFAEPQSNDYRPVSMLAWAPNRAVSSALGTAELAGFKAPTHDITGARRTSTRPDLGAYEVRSAEPRPRDGVIEVAADDTLVSAALFTPEGIKVATLFDNLPLGRGAHPFWIPARDFQGRPIAAGDYQVRVVESKLGIEYLGTPGGFARSPAFADIRGYSETNVAFDDTGRVFLTQGWSENHLQLRAFDAGYRSQRWAISGSSKAMGLAVEGGEVFMVTWLEDGGGNLRLRRFAADDGKILAFDDGKIQFDFALGTSPQARGLAALKGRLFFADTVTNKLHHTAASKPTFDQFFEVPSPTSPSADTKNNLVWVISGGTKILALDPVTGAVRHEAQPVESPDTIAISQGRMAVLSRKTGKVHLLDCSDPANLKPLSTLGRGDGPYGPIEPDRFWFQTNARGDTGRPAPKTHLALDAHGRMFVIDGVRTILFAADGKMLEQGFGIWGQHVTIGKFAGDTDIRVWEIRGDTSIRLDAKTRSWTPDVYWDLPPLDYQVRAPMGYFTTGGKNFGVFSLKRKEVQLNKAYAVMEFAGHTAKVRSIYWGEMQEPQSLLVQHDTNGDGEVNEKDEAPTRLLMPDGKPIRFPGLRYDWINWRNGDIICAGTTAPASGGMVIPMRGLDQRGIPIYDWAQPRILGARSDHPKNANLIISPYDFKTEIEFRRNMQIDYTSDGGYVGCPIIKTSGGTGLHNGAGTDLFGFTPDGRLRWFHPFNTTPGIQGVQTIPEHKLVLSMFGNPCDYHVLDEDGLGLGVLGMPRASEWGGMWSDHAQQQAAWTGNDGRPMFILGDYVINAHHWMAITGADQIRRQTIPMKINADLAASLAAAPPRQPVVKAKPATQHLTIKRLEQPLPIDGDLAKWRALGLSPQITITPEAGSAGVRDIRDCSALVRLAYHGTDLYVQAIVFDEVVSFHQPAKMMFKHDGMEMAINSFMAGFKYNVGITTDGGPTVRRDRFVVPAATRDYTAAEAPRVVRILDSAASVEERKLLEVLGGVEVTGSRAIVYEFTLPLTPAIAFSGDFKADVPQEIKPGTTMWLGFCINDNDTPGSDIQDTIVWPASYGTFEPKESGVLATFE